MDLSQYQQIIEKVDLANASDPKNQNLLQSQHISDWILKLRPEASFHLKIAARAKHIYRWEHPRNTYPEGRAAYLKWRADLLPFHAEKLDLILIEAKVDLADRERIRELMLKKNLKNDPESQTLEDALTLEFLQWEFSDFVQKTDSAKLKDIVQKVWKKISPQAQALALQIPFAPEIKQLILDCLR